MKSVNTRRDLIVACGFGVLAVAMVGAAYAAVPFYNWFCRTTGFGGTTQVSEKAPGFMLDRTVKVRFDSNIAPGLPWKFAPEKNEITVHIGEVVTALYKVTNLSARATLAQAGYNVTPLTVGGYFNKINCFCFTQQRMAPGETREMAVVFYVDPSIVKDSDQDALNTITLSYTFYPLADPQTPVADATDKPSKNLPSGKL
jgi:cytochrome c oxidase assembly protein subunit 11